MTNLENLCQSFKIFNPSKTLLTGDASVPRKYQLFVYFFSSLNIRKRSSTLERVLGAAASSYNGLAQHKLDAYNNLQSPLSLMLSDHLPLFFKVLRRERKWHILILLEYTFDFPSSRFNNTILRHFENYPGFLISINQSRARVSLKQQKKNSSEDS